MTCNRETKMALPGVPQTFAIESARDLTDKLWWSIEEYRTEPELQPKLWRAYDCAVTAWHISDWIWRERSEAGLDVGTVTAFQNSLQAQSRVLRLCKYIATASKHAGVDRKQDPTIEVTVTPKPSNVEVESSNFSLVDRSQDWDIIISDSHGTMDALAVFYAAQTFWEAEVFRDERRQDPGRFQPEPEV